VEVPGNLTALRSRCFLKCFAPQPERGEAALGRSLGLRYDFETDVAVVAAKEGVRGCWDVSAQLCKKGPWGRCGSSLRNNASTGAIETTVGECGAHAANSNILWRFVFNLMA